MEIKKMLQYIFVICAVIKMFYKALLKAGLHYGDYRSKLVHFEEQKIFFMVKKDLALSDKHYKHRQCK